MCHVYAMWLQVQFGIVFFNSALFNVEVDYWGSVFCTFQPSCEGRV